MRNETENSSEHPFRKLLLPLIISIFLGLVMLFGGNAYQAMGLEALANVVTILGYALGILEFLVLAILLQRIMQHIVLDRLVSVALGAPTPRLLTQLSAVIIYGLAIAAIVGVVFKKDLTVILTAFGGASLVIGLALQGLIHDLFAGLTINLDRSIKMGDFIYLNKSGDYTVEGEVKEVSWRTMRLLDTNNNMIIIPNSQVATSVITNFSTPERFFEIGINITLDVDVPVERALRLLQAAAIEASPNFSPPEAPQPSVSVRAVSLQGVEYSIFVFPTFKTRARSRNLVQQQVLRHLNFAGLAPARLKQENHHAIERHYRGANNEHLANLLGVTEVFQDLIHLDLLLLMDAAIIRRLQPNALLIQGGEIATSMFLVVEGLLIAEEWRKKLGQKGIKNENIVGPGQLISSTAMLAGGSYDATIRAKTMALVCELDYSALEKLFIEKPQAGCLLSGRVAEQLKRLENNQRVSIEDLTAQVFKNLRRSFSHLELK
ncbi:MAG: mechanosensitive ion channel domain-containing protein [Methylococcaceae bacterium]